MNIGLEFTGFQTVLVKATVMPSVHVGLLIGMDYLEGTVIDLRSDRMQLIPQPGKSSVYNTTTVDNKPKTYDDPVIPKQFREMLASCGRMNVFDEVGESRARKGYDFVHTFKPDGENFKGRVLLKSPEQMLEEKKNVEEYLAKGWIKKSTSKYGFPTLFVRKKDGSLRWCVDFRELNKVTEPIVPDLPRMDVLKTNLAKAKYITKVDLQSAFHQIRIKPEDTYKFAFLTCVGHYEWLVMPSGLCNVPGFGRD